MDAEPRNYAVDVKELILTNNGKSMGTETFVYEPANIEEEKFGNLYIIGWLQNRRHEFEFLPNLVASVIRREFYALDERSPEEHFESALKKANATLLDINKENKDIIRDVHFCAANVVNGKIRICVFGDMVSLLCRHGEVVNMEQRAKRRTKTELFSEIFTGDVASGDTILLGTKAVIDLFSDKGIAKLLTLPLLEQSDIITKIYKKNAQEALLPDQAIVLIGVTDASRSRWIPGKKAPGEKRRIDTSPAAHERAFAAFTAAAQKAHATTLSLAQHARTIPNLSVRRRNARILFSIFAGIIVFGSIYAMLYSQFSSLSILEQKIARARTQDPITAADTLLAVRADALAYIPSLMASATAQRIFQTANENLSALYGIRITHPVLIAQRHTAVFAFEPEHIFENETALYVFSNTPSMILKAAKNGRDQRFSFPFGKNTDFPADRMTEKNGDYYFINTAQKAAVIWHPADNTLADARIPDAHTARNMRETDSGKFIVSSGAIVRTDRNGTTTKYLIGQLPPPVDFTVSRDGTALYILAEHAIYAIAL